MVKKKEEIQVNPVDFETGVFVFKNKSAEIFDQKSELSILRSSLVLKIHRSHLPLDSFAHFYLETRKKKREEEHRTFSSVFFFLMN